MMHLHKVRDSEKLEYRSQPIKLWAFHIYITLFHQTKTHRKATSLSKKAHFIHSFDPNNLKTNPMSYQKFVLSLLFLLLLLKTSEAASNQLLGIPFGSKLSMSICPEIASKSARPCWINRPFTYKPTGQKSGPIHVPDSNNRPNWAAYVFFDLQLDRSDIVEEIKVRTIDAKNVFLIAESISQRFGAPVENELRHNDIAWAKWRSSEGYVEMVCQSACRVEFRIPSAQASRELELVERAKKSAARPTAP